MAEGGGEFGYDNPILDNDLDNDDSNLPFTYSDIEAAALLIPETEEKLSVTAPFVPSGSSTPYHGGETFEMPSYDERTPLIERNSVENIERRLQALRNPITGMLRTDVPAPPNRRFLIDEGIEIQKVKNLIKPRFPNAKVENMNLQFSTDPKQPFEIVLKGPRGGQIKVLLDDGSGFQKKFLNTTFIKKSLGNSYEELSRIEAQSIYGETQNLLKDEVLLKDAESEKKKQNEADIGRQETERIDLSSFLVKKKILSVGTLEKKKKIYEN